MSSPRAPMAIVVGGGPAGLFAAEHLASAGLAVAVHERMPTVGRKFLMAGRGGLNLTHSEPLPAFTARYGDAHAWLAPLLGAFPPERLRAWCEGLGQSTFIGSSGRVFPTAMKASPLLRAWLTRLEGLGVRLQTRSLWRGWDKSGALLFEGPHGREAQRPDVVILALGGASWPRLGADGAWTALLAAEGVAVTTLAPSNAGVTIAWSEAFAARWQGAPLKRLAVTLEGERRMGEAVVTRAGLEGGVIYALGPVLRDVLARDGVARLSLDLRPDLTEPVLAKRLAGPRAGASAATWLRKRAGLSPLHTMLLREAGPLPDTAEALAARIKAFALPVLGLAGFERAISTAGGVARVALDDRQMLMARPGVFVAGEMLDWDAPTGGYLLQGCFATAQAAAKGALAWLSDGAAAAGGSARPAASPPPPSSDGS